MKYLREATCALEHINKATEAYLTLHPNVGDQTFAALAQFITDQEPNFSTTAASMGYAAATTRVPAPQSAEYAALVQAITAEVLQAHSAALAVTRPPNGHKTGANGNKNQHHKSPKPRPYCFVHGYSGHSASQCKVMTQNSDHFTAAQHAASDHTQQPGGSTKFL